MKTFLLAFFGALAMSSSCNRGDNTSNKPSAKFSITGYEIPTPCTITLINTSSNATSYLWDFGDGSSPSTQFNPIHIYNFNGSFLIKLKVTGPAGTDSICKLVAIEPPPASNKSAFSYFQDRCNGTPVGMGFKTVNPLSTNTVWDFGTGPLLIDRDPITQFLTPGDYTIKYSSLISGVRDTVIRVIRID